jgi:hypothetical protein
VSVTVGEATGRDRRKVTGLASMAGIASLAFGVVALPIDRMWAFPGTTASASEILDFAQANRPALLVAMLLTTVAVGLWLMFGVGVWLWLKEEAGGESVLSVCFLAGLVSFVTLLFAGFTIFIVLVYRAPEVSDPRLLYDLSFGLLAMSGIPTALALGAYATLAFGNARMPIWTAWLAVVAALAHLLLFASLVITRGFFSLEGGVTIAIPATLFAWIVGTAVAMAAVGPSSARR